METIRTYYTFDDLFSPNVYWFKEPVEGEDYDSTPFIKSFYEYAGLTNWKESTFALFDDLPVCERVIRRLITYWHTYDVCLAYTDEKSTVDTIKAAKAKVSFKMLEILNRTKSMYTSLIGRYQQMLNSQYSISSTSEMRFNDTPTAINNYSAENCTTNVTTNTTTQNIDPVARYDQIKRQIADVYEIWLQEFKVLEIRGI